MSSLDSGQGMTSSSLVTLGARGLNYQAVVGETPPTAKRSLVRCTRLTLDPFFSSSLGSTAETHLHYFLAISRGQFISQWRKLKRPRLVCRHAVVLPQKL